MLGEEVKRIALVKKGKKNNNREVASRGVDLFQRKQTRPWNSGKERGQVWAGLGWGWGGGGGERWRIRILVGSDEGERNGKPDIERMKKSMTEKEGWD